MALSALVLVSPLLLYNWRHVRSPFVPLYSSWNLLDGIGLYRVEPWLYYRVPNLPAELWEHRERLAQKLATNLLTIVPRRIWNLWRLDLVLPLAIVAPVFLRSQGMIGRCATWSVGFFALELVVFSALRLELEDRGSPHHGRYFFWFAAPALLLGAGVLRLVRGRMGRLSWLVPMLLVTQLVLFGAGWRDIVSRHTRATNLGHDPVRRMLARLVTDGRAIASNQPQITAWFCGLRSILLPADPTELAELNRVSPTPADFLFIDVNFNYIDLDEAEVLREYEYVLHPQQTRPLLYVLLRLCSVKPSAFEQQLNPTVDGDGPGSGSSFPGGSILVKMGYSKLVGGWQRLGAKRDSGLMRNLWN